MVDLEKFCHSALSVIEIEALAVSNLSNAINQQFIEACQLMLNCSGRIVVTGMGKSGHIGGKIAATLASTGSPAFFVHPGEASHGDLGMITANDVVLAISNSGETEEILTILPLIKRFAIPLITMTGNPESTMAKIANAVISIQVAREACPLDLAPTASTTAALVMGDALAVALLEARGFTAEDFALSHPGGQLGRRLLLRVADLMHTGSSLPIVAEQITLAEALVEISQKGFGMTIVTDKQEKIIGIFTDGDLRRALDRGLDLYSTPIATAMTPGGKTIAAERLAVEALQLMETHKITALVIPDQEQRAEGLIHMHDLLRAGVI